MLEVKQYRKVKQLLMVAYLVNKLKGEDDHFNAYKLKLFIFIIL